MELKMASITPAAPPKFQTLELLLQDRLLTVILNRPKRFNAFTGPMYEELVVALQWADSAATVSVCMLTANGTYYSSGNDLGSCNETLIFVFQFFSCHLSFVCVQETSSKPRRQANQQKRHHRNRQSCARNSSKPLSISLNR
jgi:enoyl-CoA hydratase/carnithine racemase